MRIFDALKNRAASDGADALVVFLISLPFFMVIIGFAVNVTSSVNNSVEYKAIAQNAVEVGIKKVNSAGRLDHNAVEGFLREYRIQSGDSGNLLATSDTRANRRDFCEAVEVNGTMRQMPYIEVKLETKRGANSVSSPSWVFEGRNNNEVLPKNLGNRTYRAISATVWTASPNTWRFPGLSDCQTHRVEVSAITFGSNADI